MQATYPQIDGLELRAPGATPTMASTNRHISLRELRTFCVAAEHSSFREAGERLFITASAVSHQIRNLETELGRKLFERGVRSISLTTDGELLYNETQPLLAELDSVLARYAADEDRVALRISVQPFFASELFVPKLPEFRERYPDVDLTVDTSDESSEKHPANADASIRVFSSPPTGLASDPLFPLRLIPAGSPEFYDAIRLRGKKITSPFPVVVHESRSSAWQDWERRSGFRLPRDRRVLSMDSMIAVARAAERGLGAALVPVQLSDSWFRNGTLVPLFDHELETRDTYYFVYRPERRADDSVRLVREWVLQNFADST
jgi:LysR family glycine cleavage system transcriptional activator